MMGDNLTKSVLEKIRYLLNYEDLLGIYLVSWKDHVPTNFSSLIGESEFTLMRITAVVKNNSRKINDYINAYYDNHQDEEVYDGTINDFCVLTEEEVYNQDNMDDIRHSLIILDKANILTPIKETKSNIHSFKKYNKIDKSIKKTLKKEE